MPTVSRSADVTASPTVVFEYLEAGEHVGEWMPDIKRSARLTPGPVAPGSRFLYVFRVLGRDFEITNEVTELEPPERIGFQAVVGVGNRGWFEVLPLDDGRRSRVSLWVEFDLPTGAIGAIARRLPVAAIMDRYAQAALANLVRRLETLDQTQASTS